MMIPNEGQPLWRRAVSRIPPRARLAKRAIESRLFGEPEIGLLSALSNPESWALDIGANYGVYSWHLARCSAGVIAFEPQPGMTGFLKSAFGNRIQVEEVALSSSDGEAMMRIPLNIQAGGCATIEGGNKLSNMPLRAVLVPMRRLDSYTIPRVGFIKIDVEGHELEVLKGAQNTLVRDLPNMIIEAEERHRQGAVQSVSRFLGNIGYKCGFVRSGRLHDLEELGDPEDENIGLSAENAGIQNFVFSRERFRN